MMLFVLECHSAPAQDDSYLPDQDAEPALDEDLYCMKRKSCFVIS